MSLGRKRYDWLTQVSPSAHSGETGKNEKKKIWQRVRRLGAQGTAAGVLSGCNLNAPILMRGTDIASVSLDIDQEDDEITAVEIKIRNSKDFLNICL